MWAAGHAAGAPWLLGAMALFTCTELCGLLPEAGLRLGLSPCFALPFPCSSGSVWELLTLTLCPCAVFLLQVLLVIAGRAGPDVHHQCLTPRNATPYTTTLLQDSPCVLLVFPHPYLGWVELLCFPLACVQCLHGRAASHGRCW